MNVAQPPQMQKYEMAPPDEDKLSDRLGWPLFHRGEVPSVPGERTVYTCESLSDPYQAPLQVNDECGSMRKAFRTALRPAALKELLLLRVNRIAWHENLARLRRDRDRLRAAVANPLIASTDGSKVVSTSSKASVNGDDADGADGEVASTTTNTAATGTSASVGVVGVGVGGGPVSTTAGVAANAVGTASASAGSAVVVDGVGSIMSRVVSFSVPSVTDAFPLLRAGTVANTAQIEVFFSRLASTVIDDRLVTLCPLLQHGFPKDTRLIEWLASRLVPLQRAVWLLRVLQLTNTARANALCESVTKALGARLAPPAQAAAAASTNDPSTVYLIRLIEWIVAERLIDDRQLALMLLTDLESAANLPRKTAVMCYLLQPLLIRLARLQPNGDSQFVAAMVERLQTLHDAQQLAGPLAVGLRALLRTLLLTHASLASPLLVDSSPARRVLLHQFCAAPQSGGGRAERERAADFSIALCCATIVHDGNERRDRNQVERGGCCAGRRYEQARELQATDCVILPSSVLSAAIVDRIPMWLDAFAGAVRIRKQLAPLAAATHLGERRFAISVRRALEWAVTPMRGGRDRPLCRCGCSRRRARFGGRAAACRSARHCAALGV
jgi:hypothetical protein